MHWNISPRLTLPPCWNRTIVSPFLILKMERGEGVPHPDYSSDGECAANLQEMLEMSIGILRGLATEWTLLHHIDESWFEFETTISDVCL
jgi:hypothetical protein